MYNIIILHMYRKRAYWHTKGTGFLGEYVLTIITYTDLVSLIVMRRFDWPTRGGMGVGTNEN